MITRRELIQKFVLFGGTAIGSGAFGSLLDRSVFAKVSAASGPIVTTNLGKLRGAHVNGVYSFKGIHLRSLYRWSATFPAARASKPLDRSTRRAQGGTASPTGSGLRRILAWPVWTGGLE